MAQASGGERVFTNGCFDLLHLGHVRLLQHCRKLAWVERVVVGINSDDSIRALKGVTRPFVPQEQRREMLLALRAVDEVHIFGDEKELATLVEKVGPDVLVKGGDWRGKPVTGAEHAGRVEYFPLEGDLSTTRLAERIILAHAPDISGG